MDPNFYACRYLYWVKPHVDDADFETTKEIVKKFESGIGKELQERLLCHAAQKKNWVSSSQKKLWWHSYKTLFLFVEDYFKIYKNLEIERKNANNVEYNTEYFLRGHHS